MAEKAKQNIPSSLVVTGLGLSLAELIVLRNIKEESHVFTYCLFTKPLSRLEQGLTGLICHHLQKST